MKQRPRRYITDSEMAVIWDRWEKGDSINAIARDLGRYHSVVQGAMACLWRITVQAATGSGNKPRQWLCHR
jgi:hypothetical protein